ncbi:unnamed protein product [Meganyctiphanes norvegica]|uniref:Lipocalin/cytosolic fatty-acid binding domain-containing protein n=1 Tax=Meganyctiphanes norvegica TaxID=48144 RepID=A0AAV2QZN4_MEGNR
MLTNMRIMTISSIVLVSASTVMARPQELGVLGEPTLGLLGEPTSVKHKGTCPNTNLVDNFDIDRFLGTWYEIKALNTVYQNIKSCHKSTFNRASNGVQIKAVGLDQHNKVITSLTNLTFTDHPAKFNTDFVSKDIPAPIEILDTDYDTYACMHSCVSVASIIEDMVFIYARKRTVSQAVIDKCLSIFYQYPDMYPGDLTDTPHTGC